ncbi:MAG: ribulose-phosphate 3-epimerase [Planctomycetaceae bacterium]|nr:ribulose-phosphate 3-epimerase [Planctomycetaceae bacterium]
MSPRQRVLDLRHAAPVILPSLLLCDFGKFAEEIRAVEAAGAQALHLDVMDGVFVDNITYGMPIIAAANAASDLPLDVHLMIDNPVDYVDAFVDAGADVLTVHVEAKNPRAALERIRQRDAAASLAINPSTPLGEAEELLPLCDMVLAMSVHPGFGAQEFDPVALEKLQELRERRGGELLLEIDGGVNAGTIARCTGAGASMLVVGSAIFKSPAPYAESLEQLNQLARQ